MRARTLIAFVLATGGAVLGGAGPASAGGGGCMHGTAPTDGEGAVVELVDACFSPTVLHVDPGAEVSFVNRDDLDHQVIGVGGSWGSPDVLGLGDRVSYTFADDGVYVFSCFLHPGMVGAIVAGSGTGAAGMGVGSVGVGTGAAPDGSVQVAGDGGSTLGALLTGATVGLVLGSGAAAAALRRRRRMSVTEPTIA
jgi:plastocyanin